MPGIRWRLVVFPVAALAVAACFYSRELKPVDGRACAGLAESQLVEKFGKPTDRFSGSFGLPPASLLLGRTHVETLTWQRSSGTLYASLSDESGRAICFDAAWLPKGAAF